MRGFLKGMLFVLIGVAIVGLIWRNVAYRQNGSETLPTSSPTTDTLSGTAWLLTSLRSQADTQTDAPKGVTITAAFNNGVVSGNSGCNDYSGSYAINGQGLTFGPMASTKKMCTAAVMSTEDAYLKLLTEVNLYTITGTALTLSDTAGQPILVYSTQSTTLTNTRWEVIGYNNGKGAVQSVALGTTLTANFSDTAVGGNGGCNSYNGTYAVDGKKISIGPVSSTMMACDEAVMNQETAYLTSLQKASVYEVSGTRLELRDATGALMVDYQQAK